MRNLKEESGISKRISLAEKHKKREELNEIKKEYVKPNQVFPFWIYPVAGLATLLILAGIVVMTYLAFSPAYLVQMGFGKKAYILLAPSILIVIYIGSKLGTKLQNFLKQ